MGDPQVQRKTLSINEWLALEQSEDIRFEYHFGEVFAMAGGTINHTRIGRNALVLLDNHFAAQNKNCEAFQADLKVEVNPKGRYVYPDTVAICGDLEESEHVTGAVRNPILVIEVISESSGNYDQGPKFRHYSRIPSVREYLILDQDQAAATLYRRGGVGELFGRRDFVGMEAVLQLASVGLELPLSSFYRNVNFSTEGQDIE